MAPNGYLALILHAHLPYVRHPEYDEFLEEDWLYEAITETYLPLLRLLSSLTKDDVRFQLTLTLSVLIIHGTAQARAVHLAVCRNGRSGGEVVIGRG